jgi:hypothetical protein
MRQAHETRAGLFAVVCALGMSSVCGLLSGCATQKSGGVVAVGKPTAAAQDIFAKLKTLEGEWESQDPETGAWRTSSVFSVSSNGSVVREIMMPGTPYEMTNMYHCDGDSVVVTHFCAIGNQPRMRARKLEGNTAHFTFDSVSNLADANGMFMGDLKVTIVDADNFSAAWRNFENGKLADTHAPSFVYRRKRS